MKNSIFRVTLQSLLFFALTISFGLCCNYNLNSLIYIFSSIIFIIFNIVPSFCKRSRKKIKALCDGADLLCVFLLTLSADIIYMIFADRLLFEIYSLTFWLNIIIMSIMQSVIFWNGIIRVYCCATMIGFRFRVLGIVFGFVPIANIIVLIKIISLARIEVDFEEMREKRNSDRKEQQICKTKYPVLLVHGVFFRDFRYLNYWGRIPKELELNGAKLFYANQQSALGIQETGIEIAERIKQIVDETGCEKVNIIAHSKGGLDCRYAISKLGSDKYVSSLTTINTPHRGCVFAEWLLSKVSENVRNGIAKKYNTALLKLGDKSPDFLQAVSDLRATTCEQFNTDTPNSPNVYYQSFGSSIKKPLHAFLPLWVSYGLAKHFDGENDGLVNVDSAKWGDKFTYISSKNPDGISHADVIDLLRHDKPDLDIREVYVQILSDLKNKGM